MCEFSLGISGFGYQCFAAAGIQALHAARVGAVNCKGLFCLGQVNVGEKPFVSFYEGSLGDFGIETTKEMGILVGIIHLLSITIKPWIE